MTTSPLPGFVLALHPTSRGFGWVLFDGLDSVADWGFATAKAGRDTRLLHRFERMLQRFDPAVFVLEQFEGSGAKRDKRVQDLCRGMIRKAAALGMDTPIYRRAQIAAALGLPEKATRHAVALAVAARLNALDHRLPPERKPWVAEDPRQSLFDAAALAMTHLATVGHS